jgi:beta-lactamase regulating signal transducer with metallopeptidase domain
MSEQINSIAQMWWGWMWPMFWQVGVLVGLVWVIDLIIRQRVWPQVRYALWLLVLLKLVLPPSLAVSTSVTSALQPLAREAMRDRLSADEAGKAVHTKEGWPAVPLLKDPLAAGPTVGTEATITVGPAGTAEAGQNNGVKLCWQAYAMLGWLIGVFVLAGWLIVKFRRLRRIHLVQANVADSPRWFGQLVVDTAEKLRLRQLPEVILSRSIHSPAVFGALKPVLLIPPKNINRCSRKKIEHILLHELAHIKRGDLKVHACYLVLQIIYWFNPLLWLVRRQLRHLRELCCDATVARVLREETDDYRETILETARRLLARPAETGLGFLGLFEDSSRLPVRLKWLEKKTWRYQGLRIAIIIAIVAVMSACVLPMAKAESIVVEGSEGTLPKASLATKGSKWGPEQATGEPDTYWAGDIPTAWASRTEDGQKEWLLLEYGKPVVPARIDIHETFNPGAVNRVSVFTANDKEVEVWSGKDPTPAGSGRGISEIAVEVNFETKRVKIYLDSPRVRGWNEIDAVALVDGSGQMQWAVHAEASSTFAEQTRTPRRGPRRGRNWGPEQATGEPDTSGAGDIPTAWASLTQDDQKEWLLLEYDEPVVPARIDIHETFNPGAVNQVSVFTANGKEVEVWSGKDPTPAGSGRGISEIVVQVNFETKRVKIYLDSPRVRGWNEIDAVALVDRSGQTQWAVHALRKGAIGGLSRRPESLIHLTQVTYPRLGRHLLKIVRRSGCFWNTMSRLCRRVSISTRPSIPVRSIE